MDKSTLSNYGWIVIVTLVLAVMLALATPFGTFVGKGASNVIKTFVQSSDNAVDENNIDVQSQKWDEYLNEGKEVVTNFTLQEIEKNNNIFPIGKNKPEYVVAVFNDNFTSVTIYKNGTKSDGIMADFMDVDGDCINSSPMFLHKATLKSVVVENGVVNISKGAISNVDYNTEEIGVISSVKLSDSIAVIDDAGLSNVLCETIKLPNNLTRINQYALAFCPNLKAVEMSDAVTVIERSAFDECKKLEDINLSKNLTEIGNACFYNCVSLKNIVLPNTLKNIGAHAFSSCKMFTELTIPDSITEIQGYTFNGCCKLSKVQLPSKLTTIKEHAFANCEELDNLVIPSTVKEIGESAFHRCLKLSSIVIPNGITVINDGAFWMCESLKEITLPDNLNIIGTLSFADCTSMENIVIPKSVTVIESAAFSGCESLTAITIPDNVKVLNNGTLNGCKNLKSVTLPNALTSIDAHVFGYCTNLKTVVIPVSVSSIHVAVFTGNDVTTISGVAGSYAQTWANQNDREFVII